MLARYLSVIRSGGGWIQDLAQIAFWRFFGHCLPLLTTFSLSLPLFLLSIIPVLPFPSLSFPISSLSSLFPFPPFPSLCLSSRSPLPFHACFFPFPAVTFLLFPIPLFLLLPFHSFPSTLPSAVSVVVTWSLLRFLPARHYARVVLAVIVCPSVCPSGCLFVCHMYEFD